MGPCRSQCFSKDSNGSLWFLIRPRESLWILIGLLWSFLGPYASLRILTVPYGFYRSLNVLMYSNGSLWVLINLYASLKILMGFYGSL